MKEELPKPTLPNVYTQAQLTVLKDEVVNRLGRVDYDLCRIVAWLKYSHDELIWILGQLDRITTGTEPE